MLLGFSPPPTATAEREPQPWPVTLESGVQALGFSPAPANPTAAIGTEVRVLRRRVYDLHIGLAVGGFHHARFARGGFVDATIGQRWTAPFGLFGEFDVVAGGQATAIPVRIHRVGDDGRLQPSRAPVRPAARVGLGLGLGFDLGRVCSAPVRLFVRYRQLAWTPFMLGNGLPAMGIASLTGGIAVEFGTWMRARRSR